MSGKPIILAGIVILALGLAVEYGQKFHIGSLPGDIKIEREGFRFYAPLATSLILSLAASGIFWLINHLRK
jgi:hypothetical protein